jgi:O-Antigen ligase
MLKLVIAAIGVSCLTPGLAVLTLGSIGIQPVLLFLAAYCVSFPLSGLELPLQPILWALANICGFFVSYFLVTVTTPGQHSAAFLVYQSLYYFAVAVGFGTVLITPIHRRIFLNAYVAAALASSAVGIAQAVVSQTMGIFFRFTNNENFSLVIPIGRAVVFAPEASILAALLLPAFACIWVERRRPYSLLFAPLRGRFATTLLLAGLIATRSSMLLLAPLVLLVTMWFAAPSWKEFVASSGRTLMTVAIAGVLFMPVYQMRTQGADDAGWSEAWRMLKISTGLRIFAHNPILGAGPGYVSDPANFASNLEIPPAMAWMSGQPNKGIDSTPVRLLAEGGALGLLLAYYPVLFRWRRAHAAVQTDAWRPFFSLALPLLFVQTVSIGYRDIPMLLLPSILFAVADGGRGNEYRLTLRAAEHFRSRSRPVAGSAMNSPGD